MIALIFALQIGVGLALPGHGFTASHSLPVRIALFAAGILIILMRTDLLAGS